MAKKFYEKEIEVKMKEVYDSLSEKQRRIYAAIEADKLPHGGICYVAQILKCNRNTIYRGLREIENPENLKGSRIRQIGGGRKKEIEKQKGLEKSFLNLLKEHTAGNPMNEEVIWTDLTPLEISTLLKDEGFQVGDYVVKQLLKMHGYVKRSASKSKSIGSSMNRDEQFCNIARLRSDAI